MSIEVKQLIIKVHVKDEQASSDANVDQTLGSLSELEEQIDELKASLNRQIEFTVKKQLRKLMES